MPEVPKRPLSRGEKVKLNKGIICVKSAKGAPPLSQEDIKKVNGFIDHVKALRNGKQAETSKL